jgi:purine-binding chemotaxis protein CheW
MNLAEIRKKAQKEKEVAAPAAPPERVALPDVVEAQAVAPELDDLFPDTALSPAAPEAAPQAARQAVPEELPRVSAGFDPMALIMAGRLAAGHDEELVEAADQERQEDESATQELLCFRVSTETYAMNIMEIKEIIKPREITEVPRVPAFVSGVLSLRGIIIPVFNMRKRLGLPTIQTSSKERIIVIKRGEEFCGLLVDEVVQVVRIAVSSIEPPPAVLDGIDREFVTGIGRHDGKMLILLNLLNILDINLS